ncbi:hypothetical protein [Arthrobacter rhombi]|uniref:hypothetical protein n=1 Tax=Arthrobacter rhombi TaxID=71253 RepID=UPI001178232B|nr:hypothetical protein [Arthrobacter rhombi]
MMAKTENHSPDTIAGTPTNTPQATAAASQAKRFLRTERRMEGRCPVAKRAAWISWLSAEPTGWLDAAAAGPTDRSRATAARASAAVKH